MAADIRNSFNELYFYFKEQNILVSKKIDSYNSRISEINRIVEKLKEENTSYSAFSPRGNDSIYLQADLDKYDNQLKALQSEVENLKFQKKSFDYYLSMIVPVLDQLKEQEKEISKTDLVLDILKLNNEHDQFLYLDKSEDFEHILRMIDQCNGFIFQDADRARLSLNRVRSSISDLSVRYKKFVNYSTLIETDSLNGVIDAFQNMVNEMQQVYMVPISFTNNIDLTVSREKYSYYSILYKIIQETVFLIFKLFKLLNVEVTLSTKRNAVDDNVVESFDCVIFLSPDYMATLDNIDFGEMFDKVRPLVDLLQGQITVKNEYDDYFLEIIIPI